jgi:hypothetical protein
MLKKSDEPQNSVLKQQEGCSVKTQNTQSK